MSDQISTCTVDPLSEGSHSALARNVLGDRAVPAETFVGLVARRECEADHAAGLGVEAGVAALVAELYPLAENPAAVGRGDHGSGRVEQHHAGALLLLRAHTHALHDALCLRSPVEEDAERADGLAVRVAAGADRGGVGGHRGVAELR